MNATITLIGKVGILTLSILTFFCFTPNHSSAHCDTLDKLVDDLTKAMANGIRERFHRASETRKHADQSVAAGREFVEAYVTFTHYVEGLHGLIKAGPAHYDQSKGYVEGGHGH